MESTADLLDWIAFMDGRLRDGGTLTLVHRAEREHEITDALSDGYGDLKIMDVVTVDDGRPVKRVVVQGVKGGGAMDVIRSRIVVHDGHGNYTPEAEVILRDAGPAPISARNDQG